MLLMQQELIFPGYFLLYCSKPGIGGAETQSKEKDPDFY